MVAFQLNLLPKTSSLLEWPVSRTVTAPSAGEDVRQEVSFTAGGNINHYHDMASMAVWQVLKKLTIFSPYNPEIMLLGIHPKELKTSVQFSRSVMSDSLQSHELQHARPPCPSPTPGVYSNSCLSSWICHPTTLSSVLPFSSCPQSLPASESFPMSQLFT